MIQSSRGYTVVTLTLCHASPEASEVQRWSWESKEKLHYDPVPTPNPKVQILKAIYQLVEFVACSPSQVQNPTFLSTIHHRSSLPFPSGHPGLSSRWKIGPWPGVYEGEWSAVFSSAVGRLFPIERKTWRSFPLLFSDLKSRGKEGMLHVASISQRAI